MTEKVTLANGAEVVAGNVLDCGENGLYHVVEAKGGLSCFNFKTGTWTSVHRYNDYLERVVVRVFYGCEKDRAGWLSHHLAAYDKTYVKWEKEEPAVTVKLNSKYSAIVRKGDETVNVKGYGEALPIPVAALKDIVAASVAPLNTEEYAIGDKVTVNGYDYVLVLTHTSPHYKVLGLTCHTYTRYKDAVTVRNPNAISADEMASIFHSGWNSDSIIELPDDLKAVVTSGKDIFKVGCQSFTVSAIKEVLEVVG